jgi:hypothetical protein
LLVAARKTAAGRIGSGAFYGEVADHLEREHPERGRDLIDRLAADVDEVGKLEGTLVFESRTMTAVFAPR